MPRNFEQYAGPAATSGMLGGAELVPAREDVRSRFEQRRKRCEIEMAAIDEGLKLLDRNPDIEKLLEILGRVGY